VNNDRFLSMVYSAADVFAICSLQDNLPNTVLEALACGVPVVGVNAGGIPEVVRNGENGVTVDSANPDALATAISDLLNDPVEHAQMKASSRRLAVEEYALELQAQNYANLYESLLANRGTGVVRELQAQRRCNGSSPNVVQHPGAVA
jgi:glycosyltransferase involved in cell wall biosynthesis